MWLENTDAFHHHVIIEKVLILNTQLLQFVGGKIRAGLQFQIRIEG